MVISPVMLFLYQIAFLNNQQTASCIFIDGWATRSLQVSFAIALSLLKCEHNINTLDENMIT
ncbi:hypothetical protein [Nostoc sp.]|uniref:hypothetical protein n=1 Tax=Nostoc sp. TaxID=1180 RepID=UPI003594643F